MAYPAYIREKAVSLRRERGMTIDEIAELLAPISRTTIYYWVGDVAIERTTKQTKAQRAATKAMQDRFRREREIAYNKTGCIASTRSLRIHFSATSSCSISPRGINAAATASVSPTLIRK
jgi:hypothetical protein